MKTDMPSFYAGMFVMLMIFVFIIVVMNIDQWLENVCR